MKEIKTFCTKGTRIQLGNEKRAVINHMIEYLLSEGFQEISIPILQDAEMFHDKVGDNEQMMYEFRDRGDRNLCLAPEYTAVIMRLAKTEFKNRKNVKLFYVQECFRGEKPQAGRYRQFTQLGVEILNPTQEWPMQMLCRLATGLLSEHVKPVITRTKLNSDATRGLDYYKGGKGFEITCDELGAQKQICGGGEYEGGVGFALGIDRIMLLKNE